LIQGDGQRFACGLDRLVLHRGFLFQNAQRREIVLDFLKIRSAPSAIVGDIFVIGRDRLRCFARGAARHRISSAPAPHRGDPVALGSENNCDSTELWKPPVAERLSEGKNAASATPI